MLEFLPIKIETTLDWTLVLAIVAALAYYFGKLINEVKPTKETDFSNYLEGGMFLILYVIFPALILYTIFNENVFPVIPLLWAIIGQFILTWFFAKRLAAYQIDKLKLWGYVEELTKQKSMEVCKKMKLSEMTEHVDRGTDIFAHLIHAPIPSYIFLVLMVLEYWFTGSVILSGTKVIVSFFSLLMLLLGISTIAIVSSWGNVKAYPRATIVLTNGKRFTGDLTKIDVGYVSILKGKNAIHFKDENVSYINTEVVKKTKK